MSDDAFATVDPAADTREYAQLPEPIKAMYSFKEWMWLSDDEKGRLTAIETMPDVYVDGV